MKNIARIPGIALLLLAPAATAGAGQLKVVATTSDLGWLAGQIGGDRVSVWTITQGDEDPHYIEPKPSYIVKLKDADALFYVGLELEVGWLPRLLDGAHNPRIREGQPGLFSPSGAATILERPEGSIDRTAGDVHPFGNPHYMLDPTNVASIAGAMAERLARLDPEGESGYEERARALRSEIERRDADWRRRLEPHRGMKLVTYHKTFSYFLHHFGLQAIDCIEPRPGIPPSARHLAELTDRIKTEGVKLILVENVFDTRNAELVSRNSGAPVVVEPIAVGGDKGVDTWYDLMERLVSAVEQAARRS